MRACAHVVVHERPRLSKFVVSALLFLCMVDSYVYRGAVVAKVRNNHDANMLLKNHTLKLSFFCLVFSLDATSALCIIMQNPEGIANGGPTAGWGR